ncbi:amino acid adenylation domain-containing protein [Streptomyces sp. JJ36]|uniref:amino acid adenylation domain-containing protein n=1 Tax=Streptomyces sp. JJ36 TaxID=2736645 RepID=UPI001F38A1CE|nr:amino acid adenylation domain-containing protein [Streptomyces sp. JJ36]MCF6521792.1 amino acid adenylation domain-containing protein [Streptomyces sp. JJ36]
MAVTTTSSGLPVTRTLGLPEPLTAEQAARPALLGRERVTYGELAERTGRLAAGLAGLGARPGDRVAIWMDKQPRYAEAVLGTLRAGGVYVPLDGNQPAGRVETILGDSAPVALFTDRRHLEALAGCTLPASLQAVVVVEEGTAAGDDAVPGECGGVAVRTLAGLLDGAAGSAPPAGRAAPDALAALLYTSGSTGVPKGVKISHRNLTNFVGWARTELDVGPDDVFSNHASFNFDLSTFDLFTALSAGAAVWIVEDAQARDVAALAEGIREHGVTVWYSVPSILALLTRADALTPEIAKGLRYVLFAGEVFPMPHLRELAARLPRDTALYNLYGPTETNVCTYHRVREQDLNGPDHLPIGTAVTGARTRVVDETGATVDTPGALGELVVEGDCVTPGYWGREHEPMADEHRAHRHPTGDIVSVEDGLLVYRGRKDRMVKLNGYRLELGEIEAAALRHPDLEDVAVVVDGEGSDARLALYYTLRDGAPKPGLLKLKQHCARHLPKYMVPHTATCLPRMPRNANGKTDYRRLAETAGGAAAAPQPPAGPAPAAAGA